MKQDNQLLISAFLLKVEAFEYKQINILFLKRDNLLPISTFLGKEVCWKQSSPQCCHHFQKPVETKKNNMFILFFNYTHIT
jgi:hypothetical protein